MGPWLHPTGAWQGIIRLKFRVIPLVGVTQVRQGEGVQTNYFHGIGSLGSQEAEGMMGARGCWGAC